ncbi:MAG: GNAT family N-acetyltransferase [Simkaniaceae bacterium]|nr:GNAT family N-acetyltransferase [Simkaniaceae bacterium]
MSEITIRKTNPDSDMTYLKQFLLDPDVLRYFPMINEQEVNDSVGMWTQSAKKGFAYTAELGGIPVGFLQLYISPFEKLKHQCLFSIVVDKNHRGKGIGTELMEHCMRVGKEEFGLEILHLEVYKGNPAKRLYDRLGFVEYGEHPDFLKEEGAYYTKILMQKQL